MASNSGLGGKGANAKQFDSVVGFKTQGRKKNSTHEKTAASTETLKKVDNVPFVPIIPVDSTPAKAESAVETSSRSSASTTSTTKTNNNNVAPLTSTNLKILDDGSSAFTSVDTVSLKSTSKSSTTGSSVTVVEPRREEAKKIEFSICEQAPEVLLENADSSKVEASIVFHKDGKFDLGNKYAITLMEQAKFQASQFKQKLKVDAYLTSVAEANDDSEFEEYELPLNILLKNPSGRKVSGTSSSRSKYV